MWDKAKIRAQIEIEEKMAIEKDGGKVDKVDIPENQKGAYLKELKAHALDNMKPDDKARLEVLERGIQKYFDSGSTEKFKLNALTSEVDQMKEKYEKAAVADKI